jgi:kynurenine 3-monooxygenase
MNLEQKKIVISGAGLVGSLAAIYLAQKGFQVEVYEKRPDMRQATLVAGRSINLALSDRGWRALEGVGIDAEIRKMGIPMTGRLMHDEKGNLTYQPYGKQGQAIYSVSRGGLNQKLIEKADSFPNVEFHFQMQAQAVDLEKRLVRFESMQQPANYQERTASMILATDGAFSPIRYEMQKLPRFSYSQHYIEHAYKELAILPDEQGKHRIESNVLHIWPRKNFMLIALPNLDGSFTCTLFLAYQGEEDSFENLQTDAQIEGFFEKYFPDVLPLMPNLLTDFRENPTASLVTVKCSHWTHNNILLMGDAAHAVVPFYGQGMNAGFEDCRVLSHIIDQHKGNWDTIAQEYQAQRVENGHAIADLALQNFVEMRDKVADKSFLLRKKIEAELHSRFADQWMPLYSMVTFSHLPYSVAMKEGKKQEQIMDKILQGIDPEEDLQQILDRLPWQKIIDDYKKL